MVCASNAAFTTLHHSCVSATNANGQKTAVIQNSFILNEIGHRIPSPLTHVWQSNSGDLSPQARSVIKILDFENC